MRRKGEIVLDSEDRPQFTASVTDEPEPEEAPVSEPDLEPFEDTIPRVYDYVYLHGPAGVTLPGVVREVREGKPVRCVLQGFAANGLTQLANIPVEKVPGEEWWCQLVARFEP